MHVHVSFSTLVFGYNSKRKRNLMQVNEESCLRLQLYWKRDSATGVFLWTFCNFWEHVFYRTRPVAASYFTIPILL